MQDLPNDVPILLAMTSFDCSKSIRRLQSRYRKLEAHNHPSHSTEPSSQDPAYLGA